MEGKKFFNRHQSLTAAISVLASVVAVAGFVYGATTIGTNISVDGTLTVTGASTLSSTLGVTGTSTVAGVSAGYLVTSQNVNIGTGNDLYVGGTATTTGANGNIAMRGALTVNGSASSTFANGLNITAGCFAVGGVCTNLGAGTINSGTTNRVAYYSAAQALSSANGFIVDAGNGSTTIATNLFATNIQATSTLTVNATSTLAGVSAGYLTTSQNVQIGTGKDLYVGGNATTTGANGNITTQGTLTVTGASTLTGLASFNGNASTTLLSTTGNFMVNGNATTTATNGNIATQGTLTVAGASTHTGNTTFGSGYTAGSGTGALLTGTSGLFQTNGDINVNGNATTTASTGTIATQGKIGIASTTPAKTLGVAGDAYVAGTGTTTLYLKTTTATTGSCFEMLNSAGSVVAVYVNAANALTVAAGTCK